VASSTGRPIIGLIPAFFFLFFEISPPRHSDSEPSERALVCGGAWQGTRFAPLCQKDELNFVPVSGGRPEKDRMRSGAATVCVCWRGWRSIHMSLARLMSAPCRRGGTDISQCLKRLCALLCFYLAASRVLLPTTDPKSPNTITSCLLNDPSLGAVDWYVVILSLYLSSYDRRSSSPRNE
jgi:hypothetical protein